MRKIILTILTLIMLLPQAFAYSYKYQQSPVQDKDLEYLLSRMEKNRFGQVNKNPDIYERIDRLDMEIFGTIQDGDYITRLNRLKHAFSANANNNMQQPVFKNKGLSDFRGFFTSGVPTSIPASPEYYSSMFDNFSAW